MISISIMLIQLIGYGSFCKNSAVTAERREHSMASYKLRGDGLEIWNEVLVLTI